MRWVAAVFVVLALGALPATAAATFIPGPNGDIVFTSGRAPQNNDNEARIWLFRYPFGPATQITTIPAGQHRQPNFSPDHTKIAYAVGTSGSGNYAIWVKDLRLGSSFELVPVATNQDRPSWSPDGTKIAYGANGDIFVKDADTPSATPMSLTNDATIDERPVWSSDGQTIFYNRTVLANDNDIYKKAITTPAISPGTPVITGATNDWQPALSPDDSRVCFLRGGKDSTSDLLTASTAGTNSDLRSFSVTPGVGDLNCVWSPDGTRIAYTEGAFSAGQLVEKQLVGPSFLGTDFRLLSADATPSVRFDGNADWATDFAPSCDARTVSVAVNDLVSVPLSCLDPDARIGNAGNSGPEAIGSGGMEIVGQPAHGNLGSIGNDETVFYTPSLNFKGTDTFTYKGNDSNSGDPAHDSAPATITVNVGVGGAAGLDKTKPSLTSLRVSPKTFRRGTALPKIAARKGTTISFRLSEIAKVKLSFGKAKAGRRVGGKCRKPTRANRNRRKCTRYVNAGSFTVQGKTGANKVKFSGRLSRRKKLSLGRYKLSTRPTDGSGNRGTVKTAKLRVVRR